MNAGMVKRLVQKDWYFYRWPIAFYIGGRARLHRGPRRWR